jgi:DNA-binding Lrp family transcriptional regulator
MATINNQGKDRVKQATPSSINQKIESKTWHTVSEYVDKSKPELTERIHQLEKEWDIERYLGVNMSTLALIGVAITYFVSINWLILPAIVLIFFFQHSVQGWCPPLPILRSFKIRTRKEIEQEKYALKIIRGDFNNVVKPTKETSDLKEAVTQS